MSLKGMSAKKVVGCKSVSLSVGRMMPVIAGSSWNKLLARPVKRPSNRL